MSTNDSKILREKSNRLLINESPLIVLPTLAKRLGINRAIALQQLRYWLDIQEKTKNDYCFHEGKYWCYKTFDEWHEEMPWLKPRSIKSAFGKLRELGIVIVKSFSSNPLDRTNWYTIDYDVLYSEEVAQLENAKVKKLHNGGEDSSQSTLDREYISETTEEVANATAPKNTEKKTSRKNKKKTPKPSIAIQMFREKLHLYPTKLQIPQIDAVVTDLDKWSAVLDAWAMQGYKPLNVIGQLDWYRNGIPEYAQSQRPGVAKGQKVPKGFEGIYQVMKEDGIDLGDFLGGIDGTIRSDASYSTS